MLLSQKDQIPTIRLDIDDTLAATELAILGFLRRKFCDGPVESDQDLVDKFRFVDFVPFWKNKKAAMDEMRRLRQDQDFHLDVIKPIEAAVEAVRKLASHIKIEGYCTMRPSHLKETTAKWLPKLGFPELEITIRPENIAFEDRHQWKAQFLREKIQQGSAFIDDDYIILEILLSQKGFKGHYFLFGQSRDNDQPTTINADSHPQVTRIFDWKSGVKQVLDCFKI